MAATSYTAPAEAALALIASEGEPVQALAWVLNHIFRHENVDTVGEFVKVKLRDLQSLLISHVILWVRPFCWKERIHGLLTNLGVGKVCRFLSSLLATGFPVLVRS